MDASNSLRDHFIDPISFEMMKDPVMNQCGHVFCREQIEGWRALKIREGAVPSCPLCREPIQNLVKNVLVKNAIEVLNDPDNAHVNSIEDFPDDEQRERVQQALDRLESRWKQDDAQGVPHRLEVAHNFAKKAAEAISGFYTSLCQ
jgi:hypothetical protein